MSHEITERDGLVLTGRTAWHGLGYVVEDAPTPEDALRLAGLDWEIQQRPVMIGGHTAQYDDDVREGVFLSGSRIPSSMGEDAVAPAYRANVRADTGEVFGITGAGYVPFQNRTGASLMSRACDGRAAIESAGSLRGGREVFMLARMGEYAPTTAPKDKVAQYALLSWGHDGRAGVLGTPTDVRVVCRNTQRMAITAAIRRGLAVRFRHTRNLLSEENVARIVGVLRGVKVAAAITAQRAEALSAVRMNAQQRDAFFLRVWEALYGAVPGEPATRGEKARKTRAVEALADWQGRMIREQGQLNAEPSLWLAANAVTAWVEHGRTAKGDRAHSNLLGTAAADKDKVFALAADVAGWEAPKGTG